MIFFKEKVATRTKAEAGKEIYEEIFKRKLSIESNGEKIVKVLISESEFINLGVYLNHMILEHLWFKKDRNTFLIQGVEVVACKEVENGSDTQEFYVQGEKACPQDDSVKELLTGFVHGPSRLRARDYLKYYIKII